MDLAELDALIAEEIADKAIPSISYCLFDANEILAEQHTVRTGTLPPDPMFRIGSVSKTFAAVLAMQLVERGLLDLDADVAEYLPGFAPAAPFGGSPVTLRKLLGHRSGLTREPAEGGYLDARGPPLAATVDGLGRSRLKAPADGSAYFYSNAGFAVIGHIVETITARPYAQHLQESLLGPLGLMDTTIALTLAVRGRLAPAAMWTAEGDKPAPVFDLGSAPAGNIAATLRDAARWGQALLRGGDGILAPETLVAMWTPAGGEAASGYGLGFAVDSLDGHRSVNHGGAVYGYSTGFTLLPDAGLGVVVVSTLDFTGGLAGALGRRALRIALAMRGLGASPEAPRRPSPMGTARGAQLAGTYVATDGAILALTVAGPRLMLTHRGVPHELRPLGDGRLALDGRLADDSAPVALAEATIAGETLYWADQSWRRQAAVPKPATPPHLAPYLGHYAPAFMPTRLFLDGPQLICLIENLSPHVCAPLPDGRYLMHGPMYERETLELCPPDAAGHLAIRVGEVRLAKLDD